jgi:tRNA nucleotidyltransferase/poly(A) polymerase
MPVPTMEELKIAVMPDTARLLKKISRFLTKEGVHAYLVGGFVRDGLLGRATADIDIAAGAGALEIAAGVAALSAVDTSRSTKKTRWAG